MHSMHPIKALRLLLSLFMFGTCFLTDSKGQVNLDGKWEIVAFVMDGKPMNPPAEQRGWIDFTPEGEANILGETGNIVNSHKYRIDTSRSVMQFYFGGIKVMSGELSLEGKSLLWDIEDSSLGGIGGMMLLEAVPNHSIHDIDQALLDEGMTIAPSQVAIATEEDLKEQDEFVFTDLRPEENEEAASAKENLTKSPQSQETNQIPENSEPESKNSGPNGIEDDVLVVEQEVIQGEEETLTSASPSSMIEESDVEAAITAQTEEVSTLIEDKGGALKEEAQQQQQQQEVQEAMTRTTEDLPELSGEQTEVIEALPATDLAEKSPEDLERESTEENAQKEDSAANLPEVTGKDETQEETGRLSRESSADERLPDAITEADKSKSLRLESVASQKSLPPAWTKDLNLYQVNLRQFTEEGTLQAFAEHLPRLKELGVGVIWFLPLQPIGKQNRIGRKGSPYALKDFRDVNPEFGTVQDLQAVIAQIHELGMYVIMDWVAHQTSVDHPYTCANPEWYKTDHRGNFVSPSNDRSDVFGFQFEEVGLRQSMIEDMKYWVEQLDLDGFHCVDTRRVPLQFWQECRYELNKSKKLLLIASDEDPELHQSAFDVTTANSLFDIFNRIAAGQDRASAVHSYLESIDRFHQQTDLRLNYITSNDANSRHGSIFERMTQSHKTFAVLANTLPGMSMIFGGQEAALGKRLKTFDKDRIDWGSYMLSDFYNSLNLLRKEYTLFQAGQSGGSFARIETNADQNVLAFERVVDDQRALVLFNLSPHSIKVILDDASQNGQYFDHFLSREVSIELDQGMFLRPWEYRVLIQSTGNKKEAFIGE